MRIGVVGLGAIGSICARHVLEKQGSVIVYDIDPSRTAVLVASGATAADSAAALAADADAVVVSLPHPVAARAAFLGDDGILSADALERRLIIDLSTVDPQTSRELAQHAAARGAHYLDAPVSGSEPLTGVDAATAGALTFMVGGEAEAFEAAVPILELLGTKWHHLGPAGSGTTVKLISNLMSGIAALVAAEGLALGAAAGFSAEQLVTVFRDTDAKNFFLTDYLWPRVSQGRSEAGFAVDLQVKDHRLAAELGHEHGIPLVFNAAAIQIYEQMRRAGRGSHDVSDAISYWAEMTNVDLGLGRSA